MDSSPLLSDWWEVLNSLAALISSGLDYEELEDDFVKTLLLSQGHDHLSIQNALDWLERASLSGHVADIFSMLQPNSSLTRVANPLEVACIPHALWERFENIRNRGLIADDLAEKVLEGMRTIDTRDWEDEDVDTFLVEVMSATLPQASSRTISRILKKMPIPELYC